MVPHVKMETKRRKHSQHDSKSEEGKKRADLYTGHSKIGANVSMVEDAKIVVGIDFGTTFSGFAYALMADAEKVFTFYEWPSHAAAGAKPYCKTQTSLWYRKSSETSSGTFDLQDWGWTAYVNSRKALQAKISSRNGTREVPLSNGGQFLTKFKLHLAPAGSNAGPQSESERLPQGLSVERIIADYLQCLSALIMVELRSKFGSFIRKKDVQWCLTVPAIWDDTAKKTMIKCAQMAGIVQGPNCKDKHASSHPVVIVLEPEAASVYCQQKLKDNHFGKGSRFLVVDAGGGTVDLVVHEKVESSGVRVKEVACSTGDLCGGTFVHKALMRYLARKIDCFEKFSSEFPATVLTIIDYWENFKCSFDGQPDAYDLELPAKLASAWEAHEKKNGTWSEDAYYDELVMTAEDMTSIFDGEVTKILKLITDQLAQVPNVEAIMVVGGFSNSPYLMKRIRETFSSLVKHIMSPTDPGSAVCQGAVAFGALGADIIMSRKSRKTYGISTSRPFRQGDLAEYLILDDMGKPLCTNTFFVFTRIGEEISLNHDVPHSFTTVYRKSHSIAVTMYSTNNPYPEYVTDAGVVKVGSWIYSLPLEARAMNEKPSLQVSMFFGRTQIEVFAEPKNFKGEKMSKLSTVFERDFF